MLFNPRVGHNTQKECTLIEILEDEVLEDREYFAVNLTSEADSVRVYMDAVSVWIADNDYVVVGVKESRYDVREGDESVTICVEAKGEFRRTAVAHVVLTTTSGIAMGEHLTAYPVAIQ